MMPLARALAAGGHDVQFVVPTAHRLAVESRGFTVTPVDTPDLGSPELVSTVLGAPPRERARVALESFVDMAKVVATTIIDLPADERPDVLVRESTAWGAWLAGEVLNLPVAMFDFAPLPPGVWEALIGDLLHRAREDLGLPRDEGLVSLDRWLTIVGAPPGWFPPECFRPTTHLFRPPEQPVEDVPVASSILAALRDDRSTVYVTLGTVFNQTPGVFELVFEAVRDLPINVVATVGQNVDPSRFGPLPDHVHVAQFVPQEQILDHCDAVVAHGGYGSLMGALHHGLPVVSIPLAAGDNLANAIRIQELGAGIAITERMRSAESIRSAVTSVLTDPPYRDNAERLRSEIARLAPLSDASALIERLVRRRRPILREP